MTRHYVVGELSALLAGLEPATGGLLVGELEALRHEVEFCSLSLLPRLAQDALDLADTICRFDLDCGDLDGFRRSAETAHALRDFAVSASLLP